MSELLVNFAPTGMVPTKQQTPHVPIDPPEIVDEVLEAYEAGITIAHLHAREADGTPTYCRHMYAQIIQGIRAYAPDLIICVSLSGRDFPEVDQRADPLELGGELQPDMGSLTLGSLNFVRQASVNSPQVIQELAARMLQRGIMPELEAFDVGMVNYANYLLRKELIPSPSYLNIILGNIAGAQCSLAHMAAMLHDLPKNTLWSFGGIGAAQLSAVSVAIAMGGGVRIGLEDNLHYRDQLTTNRELLAVVRNLAEIHGRDIMSPAVAREKLGLTKHERHTIPYHGRREGRSLGSVYGGAQASSQDRRRKTA
jgi:3-keto-5-aminohexanoate cleavage enzyme